MNYDRNHLQKYLEIFGNKLYGRFDFLHNQTLDEFKQELYSRYLDSGLSREEIENDIDKLITKRKKDSINKEQPDKSEREIKKETIDNMVETAYLANRDLFSESLEALKLKAESIFLDSTMSIEEIQREIDRIIEERREIERKRKEFEEKMKNKQQEEDKELKQDNTNITSSTVDSTQENIPDNSEEEVVNINDTNNHVIASGLDGSTQVGNTPEVLKNEVSNNNELSAMMSDHSTEQKNNTGPEVEVNKQMVKKDNPQPVNNSNSGQTGSISIFNISLIILIIMALVLIAMILNILLK